jgi:hypothetical protein
MWPHPKSHTNASNSHGAAPGCGGGVMGPHKIWTLAYFEATVPLLSCPSQSMWQRFPEHTLYGS